MPDVKLTVDQVQLRALQHRLRDAGERGLTRELNKALKTAAKPIADDERRAALDLPSAGTGHTGLRQGIADAVKISVTRSDRNPGVRVSSRALLARATTRARGWRHPVFGNRDRWVTQFMSPGWFGSTAKEHQPQVVAEVRKAVQRVAAKITSKGR